MRNKRQYKASAIITAIALLICMIGTIAYFTDRIDTKATITTTAEGVSIIPTPEPSVDPDDPTNPNKPGGAVDPEDYVDPTPTNPDDDLNNWWGYLNSKALVNFNPGDKMTLSYILVNDGDLAVDIRETFIVTSSKPMTDGAPEFELFTSVGAGDYGGYKGASRTAPAGATISVEKLSSTQYKYVVQYYTLSSETETVGSNPVQMGREYYIVFNGNASNTFQGKTCTVEYVVEAKQHSAGGAADWAVAASGSLNLPISNVTLPVVPTK